MEGQHRRASHWLQESANYSPSWREGGGECSAVFGVTPSWSRAEVVLTTNGARRAVVVTLNRGGRESGSVRYEGSEEALVRLRRWGCCSPWPTPLPQGQRGVLVRCAREGRSVVCAPAGRSPRALWAPEWDLRSRPGGRGGAVPLRGLLRCLRRCQLPASIRARRRPSGSFAQRWGAQPAPGEGCLRRPLPAGSSGARVYFVCLRF